jgi:hypothetical protein
MGCTVSLNSVGHCDDDEGVEISAGPGLEYVGEKGIPHHRDSLIIAKEARASRSCSGKTKILPVRQQSEESMDLSNSVKTVDACTIHSSNTELRDPNKPK